LADYLCSQNSNFKHFDVSSLVKENELHDGFEDEFDSYTLNEDKVVDYLEDFIDEKGGMVVGLFLCSFLNSDFHTCDFFPERYFDLVVILRTDNSILYKRLQKRGYNSKKITENVQSEIMQVVTDEANESYKPEIIVELASNSVEDMETNANKIMEWVSKW
jgi:adenylate kinase